MLLSARKQNLWRTIKSTRIAIPFDRFENRFENTTVKTDGIIYAYSPMKKKLDDEDHQEFQDIEISYCSTRKKVFGNEKRMMRRQQITKRC